MASSSKRRGSSSKQSSAGKARVISVKRKDALPRKAGVSASRRKLVVQPEIVETELELEVEASAILEETTIVEEATIAEAPFALPVQAVTFPSPAPAAPAPHPGTRALVTVVSWMFSTLCRWTGVRQ